LLAKPKRAKQQPPTMIFFEVDETYFKDKAQIQQLLHCFQREYIKKLKPTLNLSGLQGGMYQLRVSKILFLRFPRV
jgi:hypothetical protein